MTLGPCENCEKAPATDTVLTRKGPARVCAMCAAFAASPDGLACSARTPKWIADIGTPTTLTATMHPRPAA